MDRPQLEDLLCSVVRTGGTSLHLMPDQAPFVRVGENIVPSERDPVPAQRLTDLMRDFLFEDHRTALENGCEVEVLYTSESGHRFRALVMRQCRGLNVVFRRMPEQIPSFQELGLPSVLSGMTSFRRGIVMVSGFYGSGKSTTLAALVDSLNESGASHISTIEESIEFFHQPRQSLIHQREIGTHVAEMDQGVRDAYLQGAEVIAIDGLKDYASLCAMFEAVERGNLVIATFCASSVVGAVQELARLAPVDDRPMVLFRLAKLLRGITAQSLIDRPHGRGRVPVFEVLIRTRTIAKAIRDGRFGDLQDLMHRGRGLGMQTNDQALRYLLAHNVITADDAAHHAIDREWVVARS